MNKEIERRLLLLEADLNTDLDRLHDELLRKLRFMAKSTGQRTRTDRKK